MHTHTVQSQERDVSVCMLDNSISSLSRTITENGTIEVPITIGDKNVIVCVCVCCR